MVLLSGVQVWGAEASKESEGGVMPVGGGSSVEQETIDGNAMLHRRLARCLLERGKRKGVGG